MAKTDPRIDAYIAKSAEFARPVLDHIRKTVHAACPSCEETIKWGMPFFTYGGRPLANMAAFKAHCAFGLWNGGGTLPDKSEAMGQLGRIASLEDLPPKASLAKMVKTQMAVIDAGESVKRKPKQEARPSPEVPPDLAAALEKNAKARKAYESFPPGAQREYVEWIVEAKREETRNSRLAQAVEWMAQGKRRHWKYQGC